MNVARDGSPALGLTRHLAVLGLLLALPAAGTAGFLRMDETVVARGRVEQVGIAAVSARRSGRVERVLCREGQRVRAGDVLIELDPLELRTRLEMSGAELHSVATRREHLAKSRATLAEGHHAESEREARELALLCAEERGQTHERAVREALEESRAVSRQELARARLQEEIAVARRRGKEAAVAHAHARQRCELEALAREIESLDDALRVAEGEVRLAQRALEDASVRAPADGLVLTRDPENLLDRSVAAGEVLLELGEPDRVRFVLQVDETDVSKMQVGQHASVHLDAFPFYLHRSFEGRVVELSLEAGQPVAGCFRAEVQVEDEAAVEVEVGCEPQRVAVRPGLTGEAVVVVNRQIGLWRYFFRTLEPRAPRNWTVR